MHVADVIVALIGIGMLVVLVSCFVAAFGVVRELWADYQGLLVRARAHPRFGMSAMFTVVTIAAVASALFRLATDYDRPVLTAIVAFTAIVLAIGIVCGSQFVLADFRESWSRKQAALSRNETVWPQPPPSDTDDSVGTSDQPLARDDTALSSSQSLSENQSFGREAV